jgi:hypothetical protein
LARASSSTRTADRRDGVAAAIVGARRPEQLGAWIGAARLELSDELLRVIDAAIPETGAARGPGPRGPGAMADVTTVPRRITAQTRAFTRTEKRMALAPRMPVLRQRLTFVKDPVVTRGVELPLLVVAAP